MKIILIKILRKLIGGDVVVLKREAIKTVAIQEVISDSDIIASENPDMLASYIKSKMVRNLADAIYSDFVTIEERTDGFLQAKKYRMRAYMIDPKLFPPPPRRKVENV